MFVYKIPSIEFQRAVYVKPSRLTTIGSPRKDFILKIPRVPLLFIYLNSLKSDY